MFSKIIFLIDIKNLCIEIDKGPQPRGMQWLGSPISGIRILNDLKNDADLRAKSE